VTGGVVYHSVSLAIEKIATETVADIMRDETFREELKTIARHSMVRAVRALRQPAPKRKAKR